ncbi:MAG TPA: DNA polymerase III subunit gamma/tau [Acidimicrobiales bacterium]|nr:DNA polymerase III subunit gamma/tau [Acidimicrobiales bacterium]
MAVAPEETPYQSLYRRFRPSTFAEVRGQDHVVLGLRNAVRDGRVGHAYLFSGPRGTGKTSTARILAKALNCTDVRDGEPCGVCSSCIEIAKGTSLDVHELDAASNNGVDAMRDLVSRAALGTPGRQKVYIVDEVHMLSTPASNALLKTLEEPPAHVVFVLATTDPQKVLPTIQSRTQHFEFRLLGPEILGELLGQVRRDAHLEVPDEAIDLAVRRGRGSARDALSVLDQVAASESVDDDLPELDEVVEALVEQDAGRALVAVSHLISAGYSPTQLSVDLVDHLRQGFLSLVAPDLVAVSGTERDALAARSSRLGLAALVRAMEVLGQAQVAMRDAPDPRVSLEVALVRLAHPEADDSPDALLTRIEHLEAAARAPGGPAPVEGVRGVAVASASVSTPGPGSPGGPAAGTAPSPGSASPGSTPAGSGSIGSGSTSPVLGKRTLGAVRRETSSNAQDRTGDQQPTDPSDVTPGPAPDLSPDLVAVTVPEPASAPSEDPRSQAPSGPFPTRDELVQAWGDHIIGRLRPKAKALFQAGRFVGAEGDKAVFGLPNETHRTRCEEVRGEIEFALSDHFGRPVDLVLVVDPGTEPPKARTGGPSDEPPVRSATGGTSGPNGAEPAPEAGHVDHPDEPEDPAVFDESELGEIADVDNSAETRVLQAFPGAEEVG